MHLTRLAPIAAALALTPIAQGATYSLTPLGDLPGGADASWGADVNDRGEAVGESSSGATSWVEGFHWASGAMTAMGSIDPSPFWSRPEAINNLGMSTGHSLTNQGWQAFRHTPGGGIVGLGYAGGCVGGEGEVVRTSYGYGINDLGQIVGASTTSQCMTQAFIWQSGGWQILSVLDAGDSGSRAHDIDNSGQFVVGTSFAPSGLRKPFLWDSAAMIPLPFPFDEADATALNQGTEMVGIAYDLSGGTHHALYWPAGPGPVVDLGYLDATHTLAHAWDINDSSQVVGQSSGPSGSDAFIWEQSVGMLNLETLLDASGAGWDLTSAHGINSLGQIVGTGVNPAGITEAYLLTPIKDEPEFGACCYEDGSCAQTTIDRCEVSGGMFMGIGIPCEDGLCPTEPIFGACCVDDSCLEMTETDCLEVEGTYHGDGTVCADVQCDGGGCQAPNTADRGLGYGWALLGVAAVAIRRRRLLS